MSGDIGWESRIATTPAKIEKPQTIQQGEKIITGENSSVILNFPQTADIDIGSDTQLEIVQTLPNSFVFRQTNGAASYEKTGESPVAVRISYLIISLVSDKITVSLDEENQTVTVESNGVATVAYNDIDYITNMITLKKNQTFVFDIATRTAITE